MSTKNDFIINNNNTIREALVALNNVSGENQSLFVVNNAQQMVRPFRRRYSSWYHQRWQS